ncbi:MAG: hypothetical protein ACREJ6_04255 [Candidatus Methylomirabilis sp.]
METDGMARRSKHESLRVMGQRYQRAKRAEKTRMLDAFTQVCGYHRKYALWPLNRPLPESPRPRRVARPHPRYCEAMIRVLAQVWEASGSLCSQRLQAALPQWLPWTWPRVSLTAEVERQLLAISPRQMDRRLQPRKRTLKRRLCGTTRPGSLLKHQIPMKTDHWDVHQPGYLEIDLVSHSGASASGEFLHTLDSVDIQTCWVERQAVRGKGHHGVVQTMTIMEQQVPFPLRGIDSDNGSEFINEHLWAFCQRPAGQVIQFTRSRPYKKDDNAHVEQKNWTPVRKLVGWNRYDRPQTPFARVCACPEADPEKVAALHWVLAQTDPFTLSQRIDQQLERLSRVTRRSGPEPRATPLPPSALVLARLDVQPPGPAASPGLGAASGQKPDAHRWLRSDDRTAGEGSGTGELGSPRRLRPR